MNPPQKTRYIPSMRTHVGDVLVFCFRNSEAARIARESFNEGPPLAGAMTILREYITLKLDQGVSLSILHPQLALSIHAGPGFQLAVPDFSSPLTALSAIHILHLSSAEDAPRLKAALEGERDLISYVNHPGIRAALDLSSRNDCASLDHQWSLGKCHFREVWTLLEVGDRPKAIGVIDDGGDNHHPELEKRIISYIAPGMGTPSNSPHAGAVSGIMSALRDGPTYEKMKGCCSADLHLYNVWTRELGFDYTAYYRALLEVAKAKLPVLNLSLYLTSWDSAEKHHIQVCLDNEVVVTAAMGSLGTNQLVYPAAYGGDIIVVGATDPHDQPSTKSNTGSHMFISAPGDCILTTFGKEKYAELSGTSFATPIVSAAIWLALRRKPCLKLGEIRELLKMSVEPKTATQNGSPDRGYGRLDMRQLVAALPRFRECV